jgi:hypothetical protein
MSRPDVDLVNLLTYCSTLAREFEARRNRVRHFVSSNNLASGNANEALLRDFFASISARTFDVGQGFICDPMRNTVSRQCDILVYDNRLPLVYREAGITIVWPDATLMVVEVKTSMSDRLTLSAALENISAAKRTESTNHMCGFHLRFRGPAP